jgi:hypothetical protein
MTTRTESCERRLPDHREGRLRDFRAFAALWDTGNAEQLGDEEPRLAAEALDIDYPAEFSDRAADDLRGAAIERADEYPLGISAYRVFRIELSTGRPADWLEVVCSGDTPRYEGPSGEPYEVERIVYHFADWFDHAEDELQGPDLEAAERFALQVIPELVE